MPGLLLRPDAPHFTIADVNIAYLKITGKKESDLVGKGIFEVFTVCPEEVTTDAVSRLKQSLLTVINTAMPDTMTMLKQEIPISDTGKFATRYWDYQNDPVADKEGNVAFIIHTVIDVTEKKLLLEKQEESEVGALIIQSRLENAIHELKKMMDSSMDVICAVDAKGNFIQVSAACETMWGYKADELIGKPLLDFVYREDHEKTIETALNVMSGNNLTNFENRYVRKDGSLVPITWSVRWDEKGQTRYGVARDATEKIEVQKIIEGERQRYAELFIQVPAFICILKGPDHIFQMANPAYTQLIGKKDYIGKTVRAVFPELKGQGFLELLDNVFTTGKPFIGIEIMVKIEKGGDGLLTDHYINFTYQAYKNTCL